MGFNEIVDEQGPGSRIETKERTVLAGNDYLKKVPPELSRGEYVLRGHNGNFYIFDKLLSMGLLMIGRPGCGKTTVITGLLDQIIPQLTEEDVMIIFDSKGDYLNRYYEPGNPRHIVVGLNRRDRLATASWNVYKEVLDENGRMIKESLDLNAGEISRALSRGMENEMQPFFSLASSDFLAKILTATVRNSIAGGEASGLNNLNLSSLLSSDNQALLALTGRYPEYAYLRSYVGEGNTPQSLGVYGHMMAVKERTFVDSFNRDDPEHDFGIREFVRNKGGKILFIEYDIRYKETLEAVCSLLFDLGIKESVSTLGGRKYFIVDEMKLLPYLDHIDDLTNFGRSYGCRTIFALQSYAQLEMNYDEHRAAAIAAGFGSMFAFQNTDFKTRKYVKERCGEVFEAYDYGGQHLTHDSFTVRDSDLRNLITGEAFVDIVDAPIFRFRFKG